MTEWKPVISHDESECTYILSGKSLFDADFFEGLDRHEMEA